MFLTKQDTESLQFVAVLLLNPFGGYDILTKERICIGTAEKGKSFKERTLPPPAARLTTPERSDLMDRVRRLPLLALLLAVLLTLTACTPKGPEESTTPTPGETGGVETTGTPEQSAPVETETAEPSEDPEDPENVTVGDRNDTLTFLIEGVEETVDAVRHTSWMGYAMTYDPEYFTLTEGDDGTDRYQAEAVEGRPNVYVAVSLVEGLTAEETVEGLRLQKDIQEEGETVALGANRYAATYLRWAEGAGSNDQVTEFYVTEQNGAIFLIETGNFVDGEEGFGARIQAMLNTLTF